MAFISSPSISILINSVKQGKIFLNKSKNENEILKKKISELENFFSDSCDDYNYLIESIDLTHFKSDELTKMNSMFFECENLVELKLNFQEIEKLN